MSSGGLIRNTIYLDSVTKHSLSIDGQTVLLFLSINLKWPFPHTNRLNPIAQIIRQHGEAIGSVIVDILHGKAKPRQLVHGLAVIIVPAAVHKEHTESKA